MESEANATAGVDRTGAVCSTVCAVHCALTAAIPGVLGALGLGALAGPAFEWGFTLVAILIASTALVIGWRRHRVGWVFLVLAAGIAGLVVGRLLEAAEIHGVGSYLSVASGIALVVGHIANIRINRKGNSP